MAIQVEVEIGSKQAIGSLNELRDAATQLEDKLNNTEFGTAEFTRLANQLKDIRSEVKDFDLQLEGLDKEQRATALVDTFNGMVGAVGAVSSAFLAFGASNEAIEETQKKLMGIIGIVQGLTEASNGLIAAQKLFGGTMTKVSEALAKSAVGQKLLNAAQVVGTTVMKAFNAVVKANPVGLLVTAILAAIAAIAAFVSSSDEAIASTDELTAAMNRQREATDRNFEDLNKKQKNRIELLKAQGKDSKAIFEQEQKDLTNLAKEKQKSFREE
jgi:ABC-type transport system involved in cytochrome bd biosynthesis fused ATPase/permease subunit